MPSIALASTGATTVHNPPTAFCCVMAGAAPYEGHIGCNPSASSWRRSPGRSSLSHRRIRCCSHPLPTSRIHHAQPDIRLPSVDGRRPSGDAWGSTFDGNQAAVPGSSVAARRSSRRTPCACLGLRRCSGRAALEVWTAGGRQAHGLLPLPAPSCPPGPTAESWGGFGDPGCALKGACVVRK